MSTNWYLMEGDIDVGKYPEWFFHQALRMDFQNAIRADVLKQNFSVVPRHWYIDAWFRCQRCSCEFCWPASEQKFWFEDLFFWVDSQPKLCKECRADARELKRLRQLYDRKITQAKLRSANIESKQELIDAINTIEQSMGKPLEDYFQDARKLLRKQIKRQTRND